MCGRSLRAGRHTVQGRRREDAVEGGAAAGVGATDVGGWSAAAHPDGVGFMGQALLAEQTAALEEARKKFAPVRDDGKQPVRKRSDAEAALGLAKAKLAALMAQLRAEELEDGGQKGSAEWK